MKSMLIPMLLSEWLKLKPWHYFLMLIIPSLNFLYFTYLLFESGNKALMNAAASNGGQFFTITFYLLDFTRLLLPVHVFFICSIVLFIDNRSTFLARYKLGGYDGYQLLSVKLIVCLLVLTGTLLIVFGLYILGLSITPDVDGRLGLYVRTAVDPFLFFMAISLIVLLFAFPVVYLLGGVVKVMMLSAVFLSISLPLDYLKLSSLVPMYFPSHFFSSQVFFSSGPGPDASLYVLLAGHWVVAAALLMVVVIVKHNKSSDFSWN